MQMDLTIRDDSDAPDPSVVQSVIFGLRLQEYCQVATIALLIYDAVITMDKEVEFFWRSSFRKPVTIVYFANRYLGIFGAISVLFCKYSLWTFNVTGCIIIAMIDYILFVRVVALSHQDKRIVVILATLLGLCTASRFAIVVFATWVQNLTIIPITDDITACSAETVPPIALVYIDWTIPMLYGLLLMILALYKGAEFWKMSAGFTGFKLVRVLVQDQAIYFFFAVSCCVFNILEIKLINNLILSIFLSQAGNVSFLSILGNRLLLNMKEAGKRGLGEGTSYVPKTLSALDFGALEAVEGAESPGTV